jgi:hypothetical protein
MHSSVISAAAIDQQPRQVPRDVEEPGRPGGARAVHAEVLVTIGQPGSPPAAESDVSTPAPDTGFYGNSPSAPGLVSRLPTRIGADHTCGGEMAWRDVLVSMGA